jgi:hypothetical protein
MSAELYLREKQLAYDLAHVRAEIKEHEVYKRVDEIDVAISQARQFVNDSYDWHQKVLTVKDTLGISSSYSQENLEQARAKLRTLCNRRKRALRALKKVKYPTPLVPEQQQQQQQPAYQEPQHMYRMSEDVKDKLATAFGWEGRDDVWAFGECHCDGSPESMKVCAVCSEKMDKTQGQSEMAKKIEEIRGLLHNHTRVEAVKAVGTECYEEKDSKYWFEEWELGMRGGEVKFQDWWEEREEDTLDKGERVADPDLLPVREAVEHTVTDADREGERDWEGVWEVEEDKMEEMRAIWEDRRMIERLKKDRG